MSRDGDGSRVLVDLPLRQGPGRRGRRPARRSRPAWTSPVSQVFIHRTRPATGGTCCGSPTGTRWPCRSAGRRCWRARRRTSGGPRRSGLDERGQLVTVPLMWNSRPGLARCPGGQDVRRPAAGPVRGAGPVREAVRVRLQGLPGLAQVRAGRRPVRVRAHPDPGRPAAGDLAGDADRDHGATCRTATSGCRRWTRQHLPGRQAHPRDRPQPAVQDAGPAGGAGGVPGVPTTSARTPLGDRPSCWCSWSRSRPAPG